METGKVTETISISCSCGGTTTFKVAPTQTNAVKNCACGKILFWSRPEATLSFSVSDSSKVKDKFG